MLIPCDRHTPEDLDHWAICEKQDALWSKLRSFGRKVASAQAVCEKYLRDGPCYASASFGKDSTVLWDLVMRAQRAVGVVVPIVWVRVEPIFNPHCLLVRDALLAQYPDARYEEITYHRDLDNWQRRGTGTLEQGFAEAEKRFGRRHMTGIRADESGIRKHRMRANGHETKWTCAPIGWWTAKDVFAYLHAFDLPVHPAYAMTRGGLWDRDKLRVANIGGTRGTGFGRSEWELTYYREELIRVHGSDVIDATL